jgi:hypothetical protein
MTESNKYIYFTEENHLNDLGISLCADALQQGRETQLPVEIQAHLQSCDQCKKEVIDFYEAYDFVNAEMLQNYQAESSSGSVNNKKKGGKFFFSIAAVFFIGMSLAIFYLWPGGVPSGALSGPNYKENPELENLIDQVYRSEEVVLLSPEVGATVSGHVVFEWQAAGIDTFYVKVLDHKENLIYEMKTTFSHWRLDKILSPGLYYWKLESTDDLLGVGKFKVE